MVIIINKIKMKELKLFLSITFIFFTTSYAQVMINGICWATRNVDMPGTFVANPEDYGMLYQWGSNIGWSSTDPLTASDGINVWRTLWETGDVWLQEKNPCPTGWRVPTHQEFQNLITSSKYWGNLNGINGRFFGNEEPYLFLPAAANRASPVGGLSGVGTNCLYWSNTSDGAALAFCLHSISTIVLAYSTQRTPAFSIRCVTESLCNTYEAAFFANNIHYSVLQDTAFCNKNVNFRAEIEGLHPTASDSIMWYIENVFETSQATWSKPFENGTYEIKMVVHYDNDTYATLTGTLKVQALWIKIRNVRY